MRFVIFCVLLTTCTAQFPPVVVRVWNAAGLSGTVPYRAVAAGSLIIVEEVPNPVDPDPSRYTVRLLPQSGGELRAQVLRTMPELLALLPAEIPPGRAQIILEVPGQTSLPSEVRVETSALVRRSHRSHQGLLDHMRSESLRTVIR